MANIKSIATAIESEELHQFTQEDTFKLRDEIKSILSKFLLNKSSLHWINKLHQHELWAMEVLDWEHLTDHDAYKHLQIEQTIPTSNQKNIITTRCPIRINGQRIFSGKPAPQLGEHNEKILQEIL
jgi:crotonobetainyl-CoA:carnitine CoA-transferase CaiB-like acyl-CoA transferase